MSYTIFNTDGTILLLLADGQVDKSATSLTLIGKNYPTYGQDINNNFIKLLANSASNSGNPPRSPLTGQLWYDTSLQRLKIYDNGFKTIGTVNVSSSMPSTLQTGDLWFDSTNHQLKLYSSGLLYNVGPTFSSTIGESGLVPTTTIVTNQDGDAKGVILLKTYGNTIGVVHYDDTGENLPFNMSNSDVTRYIPNASTSTVVSGITVIGDLSVSGKVTNNYLSLSVDLDIISPGNNEALGYGGSLGTATTAIQNPIIASILDKMFPPSTTSISTSATSMTGVLPGTQARVLCKYSYIGGLTQSGYQVRVFRTVGDNISSSWQPYYYTTATVGGTGVPINYIG